MPIWLVIILAIPQLIKFAKEIYDLWQEWKKVPKEKQAEAKVDFKSSLNAAKECKDDATRRRIFAGLRERLQAHRCEQ